MSTDTRGLACRITGHGEPVVLLHAFPLSRAMWTPQVAALSLRYRLILPDLRGFGATPPGRGALTMERAAADVEALLDRLGIEKFILGGLSMGGYVSFAILRRDAQRAAGDRRATALILADTRAGADDETARANRAIAAATAFAEGSSVVASAMVPKLLGQTTRARRPEIARRVRRLILANPPRGIANAQLGMAARLDASDILSRLDIPALILVGSEDTLTPPAEAERLQSLIRGSSLAVIPRAGHLSNLENPAAFNRALVKFLRRAV